MVKAVLDRIPDYEVTDGSYHYLGNPSMTGLSKLPVTSHRGAKPPPAPASGRAHPEAHGCRGS
ncbi:hypothetical protein MSIM_44780 [Mycobacterium simiae]|nr:hypothetical protein MSIM_44780 [Mycobacterium simiae]